MDDQAAAAGATESSESRARKYGTIWVWSILCLTIAWLSYGSGTALLMMAGGGRFGTGDLLSAEMAISFIASVLVLLALLVAMWHLYLFLSRCLLPLLFSGTDPAADCTGARTLRRAFASLLCALAVQVAGCIVGFLLKLAVYSLRAG